MIKRIRNAFIILICSAFIGTILLTIIYALPVGGARSNVSSSLHAMIGLEGIENEDSWRAFSRSQRENFTDSLMVQNALEKVEGKSPFSHAMYVYHYDLKNETTWTPEESLSTLLQQGEEGMHLLEYSKYWHGYLIFLKPLLMCMTWEGLEVFNILLQALFLIFVVVVAVRKKQTLLGAGVAVAFLYMKPVRISVSLTMSICWYVALAAILTELLWYKKLKEMKLFEEFFLLIGVITVYMDFLTYPIVTLGMPVCVYIVLSMQDNTGWKQAKKLFWLVMSWGIGYIGMWGMKWVIAEITLQTGTLRKAVWSVIYRSTPLDGYGSYFTGISRMMKLIFTQYDSVWYLAGIILLGVSLFVILFLALQKKSSKKWLVNLLYLLGAAALPFAWLIVTQNHSAIHCMFTFRVLGVSVFALWCAGICGIKKLREKI